MKILYGNKCGKIAPEFNPSSCNGCCFDSNNRFGTCIPPSVVPCHEVIFISTSKDIFKL